MNEVMPEPMTPELAARNRRIILVVAAVFVAMCVAIIIWSRVVTQESRAQARVTDAALRSVAWSILCYASSNGGAFPTSDAALMAGAAAAASMPPAGKPWPSTQESALGGLAATPLAEAVKTVGITWGATPDVVPNLNTKGSPSTFGTEEAVNGWFAEYARDRMRSGASTSERSPSK